MGRHRHHRDACWCPRPPAGLPSAQNPPRLGLSPWLFLSPLFSLSWSGDRRANPEEETAERVGGPEVRLCPVAGRQVSSARLCSTLGSQACLSASGPVPAGWRVGPSVSLLVPRGPGRPPGLPNTLSTGGDALALYCRDF